MKRIYYCIITMAAAFVLAGCSYKMYERPDTVKAEELIPALDTLRQDADTLLHWQHVFPNPHLQAIIRQGLQGNADLQMASWRIEEAKAMLTEARLSYLPSFALSPEGSISKFGDNETSRTYSLPLTASWEIDLSGSKTAGKRRSAAAFRQTLEERRTLQADLIAMIANAYYTLVMLDRQLEICEQTQASWNETVRVLKEWKAVGRSTEAAVAQAEGDRMQVLLSMADIRTQMETVRNSLRVLVGTPHADLEMGNRGEDAEVNLDWCSNIPFSKITERPDIKAAEMELEQAFYTTREAYAAFYPSLTLNGSAGWSNTNGTTITNPAQFLLNAVGSLVQPLFNKGANRARLKVSKAQQEEAVIAFRQKLLEAGTEVNDRLAEWQNAERKTTYYDTQTEAYRKAFEDTQRLMQHGSVTTYLEVLSAQQTLFTAQLNQTANECQRQQSGINLYKALGGGSDY
ncbi:MAG: TolC family protein [Prevotellaceae bacterium]|nr:TolC family protein [Prevotellaceae bacterium]